MNWMIFLFIIVFSYQIPPLMSAKNKYTNTYLKDEIMKEVTKLDIYDEYKKAQEELWKGYQEIRDEFIKGYLAKKLEMTYEEFKKMEKSLRDKYIDGRRQLLEKYFRESAISNQQSAISDQ